MKTKRMRRSRGRILAIVSQWPVAGLDVVKEARRHQVGIATIQRWRKLAGHAGSTNPTPDLLEVAIPSHEPPQSPTLRLCWPDGFALEWSGEIHLQTACELLRKLGRA